MLRGSTCAASPSTATCPADQRLSRMYSNRSWRPRSPTRSIMQKPRFPGRLQDRGYLRDRIAVEHREGDVDFRSAAGRMEDAAASRPILDGRPVVRRFIRHLGEEQADGAVCQRLAFRDEP